MSEVILTCNQIALPPCSCRDAVPLPADVHRLGHARAQPLEDKFGECTGASPHAVRQRVQKVESTLCKALAGSDRDAAMQVLEQHPALERFKLCMSSAVTDGALEALPAESLRELSLVACDGVHGHSIARLKHLETVRLSSCSCISKEAVQVRRSHGQLMRQLDSGCNFACQRTPC